MARCKKCAVGISHEFAHGKIGSYTNHGCRCEECVDAYREYAREWRSRPKSKSIVEEAKRKYRSSEKGKKKEREYWEKDSSRERQKEYNSRPEVKARKREKLREKRKDPNARREMQDRQNERRRTESFRSKRRIRRKELPSWKEELSKNREYRTRPEVRARDTKRHREYVTSCFVPSIHRQKEIQESATRKGMSWTNDEISLILSQEMTVNEMAIVLGRSPGSVYAMRHRLSKEMK